MVRNLIAVCTAVCLWTWWYKPTSTCNLNSTHVLHVCSEISTCKTVYVAMYVTQQLGNLLLVHVYSDLEWSHWGLATQHTQPFNLAFKHSNLLCFSIYSFISIGKSLIFKCSCSFFALRMLDHLKKLPWKAQNKSYEPLVLLARQPCVALLHWCLLKPWLIIKKFW